MLTGISQVLSRSSTLEPKWSTYTRGCIVFNHVLVFFRSRHLRCQQCMRRFGSVKGLSMHYAAAHGPTFQCFWCQYTVESRRFDNLKRHTGNTPCSLPISWMNTPRSRPHTRIGSRRCSLGSPGNVVYPSPLLPPYLQSPLAPD